jgi:hypothetical protein
MQINTLNVLDCFNAQTLLLKSSCEGLESTSRGSREIQELGHRLCTPQRPGEMNAGKFRDEDEADWLQEHLIGRIQSQFGES